MGQFVKPKVFMVGCTGVDLQGLISYLHATGQEEFKEDVSKAMVEKLHTGEILCSAFAKLCYKSLVVGKNANISKTRSIKENLKATFDSSHGSVFEHCHLNFIITDCSRVFTHELVRHRVGTAFSQTSGRYCRLDPIDVVMDPILKDCEDLAKGLVEKIEDTVYLMECKKGLRKPPEGKFAHSTPEDYVGFKKEEYKWVPNENLKDFDYKKKVTSAIRRFAPNGQSNEIALTINIRALRHLMMLRTAAGAEWEIRAVFGEIFKITGEKFPTLWQGAKTKIVDGLPMIHGLRLQPYEIQAGDPTALEHWTTDQLSKEIFDRAHNPERK